MVRQSSKLPCLLSTLILTLIFTTMTSFTSGQSTEDKVLDLEEKLNSSEAKLQEITEDLKALTRQMVLQQFHMEEMVRSSGTTGLKQKRLTREGSRPYLTDSHAGYTLAAMHDHSNNKRTVGMGELIAVMNGVEFRTRHIDYSLVMPHRTSSKLHKVEDIPYPPVPEAVLNKTTVEEQIVEMREWFKAWKNQDASERDYTKHFKPVICYMEGAWTVFKELVSESFVSDRHQIDADTWYELEELNRFLSYTGGKHAKENLAYLPKVIINVTDEGKPVYAQWNYRVLCHPLPKDLPLNRLRLRDDLKTRLVTLDTLEESAMSKSARYTLNSLDRDKFEDSTMPSWLLEDIMSGIPGKDNYQGNLTDYSHAGMAADPVDKSKALNTAYYHKLYSYKQKDASGNQLHFRGFSDHSLFMAMTTQKGIVGMENIRCDANGDDCGDKNQKWTYAFPLEIIYLTPLQSWNPYNITYKGPSTSKQGKTVSRGGRDGSRKNPYDGTNSKKYFITPAEFFAGTEVKPDAADTTPPHPVHVLDPEGIAREVVAAGIRIFLPSIPELGVLRQRYPIPPVHEEGSSVWKELDALKKIVLYPRTHNFMFNEPFVVFENGNNGNDTAETQRYMTLETGSSRKKGVEDHTHIVIVTEDDYNVMLDGGAVNVTTSTDAGHKHEMVLQIDGGAKGSCKSSIFFLRCDGAEYCTDRHRKCLTIVKKLF